MANRLEAPGEVVAYFGPMYSGKTAAMIEFMYRAQRFARLPVQVFKPIIDDRGEGLDVIKSKTGESFPAISIHEPEEIFAELLAGVMVVGIDEAQFFAPGIIAVVRELSVGKRITVAVAGLPTDYRNHPFGPMPGLIAMADTRIECYAICTHEVGPSEVCGDRATRTQRLRAGEGLDQVVVVGGEDLYVARCPLHHQVPE